MRKTHSTHIFLARIINSTGQKFNIQWELENFFIRMNHGNGSVSITPFQIPWSILVHTCHWNMLIIDNSLLYSTLIQVTGVYQNWFLCMNSYDLAYFITTFIHISFNICAIHPVLSPIFRLFQLCTRVYVDTLYALKLLVAKWNRPER